MCALIHMGLGEWRRLVDDLAALDLLKPQTNRRGAGGQAGGSV